MSDICHIDDSNFDNIIKDNKITVVDFWAPWCGPCKSMAVFIDKLSDTYTDKADVLFCKSNIDETPQTVEQLGIQTVPCVVYFNNGKEVARTVGNNQAKVKELVEFLLK